jgi:hypothetical protein
METFNEIFDGTHLISPSFFRVLQKFVFVFIFKLIKGALKLELSENG